MAYLPEDDKLLKDQQALEGQQPGAGGNALVGGGGEMGATVQAGPAGSPAGAGAGGWTNIQAYLNANKGDTGSATKLQNETSSLFNQEQNKLQQESSQAKTQAKSVVDQSIGKDQASKLVEQAQQNYSWDGNKTDPYNQSVNQLKGAYNAEYKAPTQFQYGLGDQTQRYGQGLGNDQAFKNIMKELYNKSAGGQMSQGQMALQEQLDVNNDALNQTRQNLLGQYSGLQNTYQDTVGSTQSELDNYYNQFNQNQQDVRAYLDSEANTNRNVADKAIEDARLGYETAWGGDQLGVQSRHWNMGDDVPWETNLTPKQAQAYVKYLTEGKGYDLNALGGTEGTEARAVKQALDDWYAAQEGKYGDVADPQKARWNSIAEILGLTTPAYNQEENIVRRG